MRGAVEWKTLLSSELTPTESLSAGIARIRPGEELAEHRHAEPEIYIVLSGIATITIDGAVHQAEPGTAVFIPGDSLHSCRNEHPGEVRFVYCFPTGSTSEVTYHFESEPD